MTIAGADEFKALLDEIPKQMQKRLVVESLTKAAEPVLLKARQLAPVETGQYRNALRIIPSRRRGGSVTVGTNENLFVGDQFYAGFLEFGFKKQPVTRLDNGRFVSMKRGKGTPTKVPGLHIIRRAAEQSVSQVREIFGRELRDRIESEQIKAERKARAKIENQTRRELAAAKRLKAL